MSRQLENQQRGPLWFRSRRVRAVLAVLSVLAAIGVSQGVTAQAGATETAYENCKGMGFDADGFAGLTRNGEVIAAVHCTKDGAQYVFNVHRKGSDGHCSNGIADEFCALGAVEAWAAPFADVTVDAVGDKVYFVNCLREENAYARGVSGLPWESSEANAWTRIWSQKATYWMGITAHYLSWHRSAFGSMPTPVDNIGNGEVIAIRPNGLFNSQARVVISIESGVVTYTHVEFTYAKSCVKVTIAA